MIEKIIENVREEEKEIETIENENENENELIVPTDKEAKEYIKKLEIYASHKEDSLVVDVIQLQSKFNEIQTKKMSLNQTTLDAYFQI